MRIKIILALWATFVTHCDGLSPKVFIKSRNEPATRNEYLAVLKTGLNNDAVDKLASSFSQHGVELAQKYVIGKNVILRIQGTLSDIENVSLDPRIRVIEPNNMARVVPVIKGGSIPPRANQDSLQSGQPGCHKDFGGDEAWGIIRTSYRPTPDFENDGYMWGDGDDGTDVDIYIVDTGIMMEHEDFEGRVEWGFTASHIRELEPDEDLHGHGTAVAGAAAGKRFGMARNGHLVVVKVLGVVSSPWSDTVEGLEWIVKNVAEKKKQGKTTRSVVNISLGTWGPAYALETAVQATVDAGITVVTSAGNSANDTCTHTPQRSASIFSVVATDINDQIASFSNYGPCSDIMAPGVNIGSPSIHNTTAYVWFSGTSMASPIVCGAIARHLSVMPDSEAERITPELIKARLTDTASRGAISLESFEHKSTPDRLLYKVCEPARHDPPPVAVTTTTTAEPTTTTTTNTPEPTSPPEIVVASARAIDQIYGMTAAAMSICVVVFGGSLGTMGFLYSATKYQYLTE